MNRYAADAPSRRNILSAGAGVTGAFFLAGCDALSTEPDEPRARSGGGEKAAGESPMLADRVKAGDLPKLAERLPATPLVVEPVEEVGVYGGELRSAILGPAEAIQLYRVVGYEGLVRWTPDWTDEVIPNIAESFEASPDAREFTFTLREGMKWSDGQPFTVDDLVFTQNEVYNNVELNPAQPLNPVTAEKIDDRTVKFVFAESDGLFLHRQATTSGADLVSKPMHYFKDFHPDHNPDLDAVVAESGLADWIELFQSKADPWLNPELPSLKPWLITTPVGEAERVLLERNPFYFKTDPEGNQLPYIDTVTYELIAEAETILLRVISGEIDIQLRPVNALANKPVLARERDAGDFRFFDANPANMNTMALCLNLTHPDPVLSEIFSNKDFRIGLSHAINRQEIIDVVYKSQGEPWQCAPRPESDLYNEELAKQYTEYDVATANEYLDKVLPDKDGDGFRLRPDGERLSFSVEFTTGIWPDYPDTLELVSAYWKDVGVSMNPKGEDRSLFFERKAVLKHDAAVWQGPGGTMDIYLAPRFYFPSEGAENIFGIPWAEWYASGGESGEEPPAAARRQMELYDDLLATTDPAAQASAMAEILEIAQDEFWVMGINLQPQEFGIASNRLRNVPDAMPNSWHYPTPAPTNPEQYYIEV